MGKSKSQTNQQVAQTGTSQTTFAPRTPQEAAILSQFQGLGNNQADFLNGLMSGSQSPFALNPTDQSQLDQAYNSAFNQFNTNTKDMMDYMATTRGLNKSDDPISQQTAQRYGLGMSDLLSQKANQGLNMGLQSTGLKMQGLSQLPSGLVAAFNPIQQERMASGITNTAGNSNATINQTYTPSLMQNISSGMGLASQGIKLGGQIAGMFSMPGMPM